MPYFICENCGERDAARGKRWCRQCLSTLAAPPGLKRCRRCGERPAAKHKSICNVCRHRERDRSSAGVNHVRGVVPQDSEHAGLTLLTAAALDGEDDEAERLRRIGIYAEQAGADGRGQLDFADPRLWTEARPGADGLPRTLPEKDAPPDRKPT